MIFLNEVCRFMKIISAGIRGEDCRKAGSDGISRGERKQFHDTRLEFMITSAPVLSGGGNRVEISGGMNKARLLLRKSKWFNL